MILAEFWTYDRFCGNSRCYKTQCLVWLNFGPVLARRKRLLKCHIHCLFYPGKQQWDIGCELALHNGVVQSVVEDLVDAGVTA